MMAYLIDPITKTVTEVEHDETHLEAVLQTENWKILHGVIGLGQKDALYVARDAGPPNAGYHFKGVYGRIYGRGLVSGHTIDGEMSPPRASLKVAKRLVSFP